MASSTCCRTTLRNYSKDTFQYNLLSSITGRGLLTSDGDFWLRQRRLAQPAFHRQRIAGFAGLMTAYAEAMLVRWDGLAARGEPIDVAAEMMHLALQIVGKALFSIEIGSAADELAQATLVVLDHIVGRARTFGIVPQWLPTPATCVTGKLWRSWRMRSTPRSLSGVATPATPRTSSPC